MHLFILKNTPEEKLEIVLNTEDPFENADNLLLLMKDYVDYVRNDLMGITREDLVANIARHVDSSVHLFEKWDLPIWKDDEGKMISDITPGSYGSPDPS